ncbi:TIGR02611 family protein [Cryobacterium sp. SO2]|uniref:TIGR02611 family protein n=1 Tax=Cryobacterium sp. SO2 TaxID=1897060 RepID=UPI00223DFD51|nr:TIGR02611 family protein [Cryobacterium sp. SO2]WEO79138.1 TIGR02611 family protein [Cryobacterium sp. SO2]
MSTSVRRHLTRSRAWIHRHPRIRAPYRVLVAVAGIVVIAVGLILVPLPGPGWLIVFIGVAGLGTEFPAAHRLTRVVRRQAHRVRVWWRARRDRSTARAGASTTA